MPGTGRSRLIRLHLKHFEKYLHGNGIDVGSGSDPLRVPSGHVRHWDKENGDGNGAILQGVASESLDFVYSSHCLEHIIGLKTALSNWCRVLKHGGFLFVVVPDYQLYEKLSWPSKFNIDHKHSFSMDLTRERVGRESHWHIYEDVVPVIEQIGIRILDVAVEDDGFDYDNGMEDQTLDDSALAQIRIIGRRK